MTTGETRGSDPFEHHAGAYVLGALTEREAADFASHLEHCPSCARSVAEVAHLPALLDRVPLADVRRLTRDHEDDDGPVAIDDDRLEPPPTLLPELLSRAGVARHRRRARWRLPAGVVAAAAAGVIVLAAVQAVQAVQSRTGGGQQVAQRPSVTTSSVTTSAPPTTAAPDVEPLVLRPVGTQPVTAAVRLESVAWGTKIELTCAYASRSSAYSAGTAYSLVVVDPRGHRQQVATWNAVQGRTLTVPAATSLRRTGISRVEVRRTGGPVLLAATL